MVDDSMVMSIDLFRDAPESSRAWMRTDFIGSVRRALDLPCAMTLARESSPRFIKLPYLQ